MSRIQSVVDEVEKLEFYQLPMGKKVGTVAAARVGRTTVVVDVKGRVYSTQVRNRTCYTFGSGLDDTLKACRLLGLLSKEAIRKHDEGCRQYLDKRERRYAAESLERLANEMGLRLTAAQVRAIEAAKVNLLSAGV